jgi:hypothetical protein
VTTILAGTAGAIAAVATVPTALLGGSEALRMMGLGGAISLASVVGGFWLARIAFRGPDRFATKLVVGGFVARMVLLFGVCGAVAAATGIEPAAFVPWLVGFYFALILVEAWILARHPLEAER